MSSQNGSTPNGDPSTIHSSQPSIFMSSSSKGRTNLT
jgi:hypothetical protein